MFRPSPPAPRPDAPLAGPVRRLVAHGLDIGLYLLFTGPLLTALYGFGYWAGGYPWWLAGWGDLLLVVVLPPLLLGAGWAGWAATPGQWLAGVRVVDAWDGTRPTPAQAARRALALYGLGRPSWGLLLLPAGLDGVRPRADGARPGRGLHDRWAETRAVRVPAALARGGG